VRLREDERFLPKWDIAWEGLFLCFGDGAVECYVCGTIGEEGRFKRGAEGAEEHEREVVGLYTSDISSLWNRKPVLIGSGYLFKVEF
jgi:hypothetical protein